MQQATDKAVLVVDDEVLVAMDHADVLEQAGWRGVRQAYTLASALQMVEAQAPDLAVLDIDLGGDPVWPLARALRARGCPFVFVSANSAHAELRDQFAGAIVVDKPASGAELLRAVEQVSRAAET